MTPDYQRRANEGLWLRISVVSIVISTIVGVTLALVLNLNASNAGLIVAVLAGVEFTSMLLGRLIVMPQLAAGPAEARSSLHVVGYSFAMSPAVVGVVAGIFSGAWYVPLIFGLIGLVYWGWIGTFLSERGPLGGAENGASSP